MSNLYGVGVPDEKFQSGLPDHNPSPSTERGKRRHAKRSEGQKQHALAAWGCGRSTRRSEKQEALGATGLRRGV